MKYDNYIIAVTILQVRWVRFVTKGTKENLALVLNTAHMKLKCKIKEICVFGSQGLECCVELQCCTSFCSPRHHNLVDLVDVDLLFTIPEDPSQVKLICRKKREHDRTEATGQASAESIAEKPSPFPFETLSSVFALFYSVLLSTPADCRKTHPVARARESGVCDVVLAVFFLRINSAASDATSARLSGGYRPVRSICFAGAFQTMSISITLLWQKLNFLWCIFVYPKCCCVLTGSIPFLAQRQHKNTNSFKPPPPQKKGWKWVWGLNV